MTTQNLTPGSYVPGQAMLERIAWSLYDTNLIGTSFSGTANYFAQGAGQSSKTRKDTNLTRGGGLPSPNEFLVQRFGIYISPRIPTNGAYLQSDVSDFQTVMHDLVAEFYVGDEGKRYLNHPLWMLPSGRGLAGFFTTGGLTSASIVGAVNNGVPAIGNAWSVLPQQVLKLTPNESFGGKITAPAGAISLSNSLSVVFILDGEYGAAVR